MIKDDEALHARTTDQDHRDVRGARRRLGIVVAGDHAADGDACADIQVVQRRHQAITADILVVDIEAVRAGFLERLRQLLGVLALVADRLDAPRFQPIELFLAAGDADDSAALGLGQLDGERADRTGGRADQHVIALFHLGDDVEAGPGGHARHAQHAQVGLLRHLDARQRLDLVTRELRDVTPATHVTYLVAALEARVT